MRATAQRRDRAARGDRARTATSPSPTSPRSRSPGSRAPPTSQRPKPGKEQTATLVTIAGKTDRVYLDTPPQCIIEDRGWRRRVVIEKSGAASTVVWNPWAEKGTAMADLGDPAWRGMVCAETGNIADDEVCLAAGGEHEVSTTISVRAGLWHPPGVRIEGAAVD